MSLTIRVSDDLAVWLRSRAEAEQIPVEDLAQRILRGGVQQPLDPEKWRTMNRRRVALIDKRFTGGSDLSAEEQRELRQLQELADRQLEQFDASIHENLSRMEAAAREALQAKE